MVSRIKKLKKYILTNLCCKLFFFIIILPFYLTELNYVKNGSDDGVIVENMVTVKYEAEKSEKLRNEMQEGTLIFNFA